MLPPFTNDGVLPPGEYVLTLDQLRASSLVEGDGTRRPWDRDHRLRLVDNLAVLVPHLVGAGITEVFIDGTFAEDKAKPGDIDGYFIVSSAQDFFSGALHARLAGFEPNLWDWDDNSRTYDVASGEWKLPMWHKYRVELFPHWPGMMCGIPDEFGNDQEFPAAFRKTRIRPDGTRIQKGIVRLGGL